MPTGGEQRERPGVAGAPADPAPTLWSAVVADAAERRAPGDGSREFRSQRDAAVHVLWLCVTSRAFTALVLYRLQVKLSHSGRRRAATLAARLCAKVGGLGIADEAWLEGGVSMPGGEVTIAGPAEVERAAVIERGVEIGPQAGGAGAPSVGRRAKIEAGARVQGDVRVGAGAVVSRGSLVCANVRPFTTVAGSPAREVNGEEPRRMRDEPLSPEPAREPPHPMAEYFDPVRSTRRERYRSYDPVAARKRRRALLTIARDEAMFFPIWLRYYSRHFAPEDIYVLDHDTADGSLDAGGFVRIPVSHEGHSTTWMDAVVSEHHRELLQRYDVVLLADVDEIVAPNPELGDLGQYLERFDEEWVNALGYEVLHMRGLEPPLDPERPVLAQRRYWYANDGYDKPAVASEPMEWALGFHRRADGRYALDPDLRLIHLHRMDFDLCRERHLMRSNWTWDPADLASGRGVHNRIAAERSFERWFYEDAASEGVEIVVERIPPVWRNLI